MQARIRRLQQSTTFRNSIWSILEAGIYPLLMVLSTPLFIYKLGIEQYGLWMLVNSILISFGMFNFGLGDATIKFVAKFLATDNVLKVRQIVRLQLSNSLVVGVLIVAVSFLFAFIVNHFKLFDLSASNHNSLVRLIPVAAFMVSLRILEQVLCSVFKGYEKYGKSSLLTIISKCAILGVQIVLLYKNASVVNLLIGSILVYLVVLLFQFIYTLRFLKMGPMILYYNGSLFKEVFLFGGWAWLQSMVIIVAGQLDKFIVASFAGLEILAYYSLGVMVFSQMHNIFTAAFSWLFPKIAKNIETQEDSSHLLQQARALLVLAALGLLFFLLILSEFIFPFWIGESMFDLSKVYITGFLAYEAFAILAIVPYFYLIGANRVKMNALLESAFKTLNVISMLVFFYFFGAVGLIYGLLFAAMIYIPTQDYIIFKRVFHRAQHTVSQSISLLFPSVGVLFLFFYPTNIWVAILGLVISILSYLLLFKKHINQLNF